MQVGTFLHLDLRQQEGVSCIFVVILDWEALFMAKKK